MTTKLTKVTFTGADDTVSPADLIEISREYPHVEWGILIGSQSRPRFPTLAWIRELLSYGAKLNLSLHICGQQLRAIAKGQPMPIDLPIMQKHAFQRCQLNWHGEAQGDIAANVVNAFKQMEPWKPTVIFQLDGANEDLALPCQKLGLQAAGLHDLSHGTGVLPDEWPARNESLAMPIGYAGGLGPDNIDVELPKIHAAALGKYWIDMETKLFTGFQFDTGKCRKVLEIAAAFMAVQ